MAFQDHNVEEDTSFTQDSDPALRKVIQRTAAAAVLQDIQLGTYWANTVGKTKKPGVYHLYRKELKDNLLQLMASKMTYSELEEFLVLTGYETGDIRCMFKEISGLDPAKLEYMRQADVKDTPPNIPGYNLGWGISKKKDVQSYFVMPSVHGLFTVYSQVDDMNRKEEASFLRHDEALECLGEKVKSVHRYDKSVCDLVEGASEAIDLTEPTSLAYRAVANRLYDLETKGALANEYVYNTVRDSVTCGNLTEAEGKTLIRKYAAPEEIVTPEHVEEPEKEDETEEKLKDEQENKSVADEIKKRTPQEFFQSNMPDRMEEIATSYIKDVLSYISKRNSDIEGFDIGLHSLQYMKHEQHKSVGSVSPSNGVVSGPPKATISTILEISDKAGSDEKNKRFALAVFFVGSSGDVTTSDSVKGEDDIIYGFTDSGLEQYFSKIRADNA